MHEWGVGWEKASSKKPRDFESVILDKDISTDICDDIQNFLNNQQWYQERNIPYHFFLNYFFN